jgi:uncharacterized sodium:solute symporter family permease YidK
MSLFDWITLSGTLIFIVVYGIWKSRGQQNIEGYLLGDKTLRWYHVMFSVIATQASAITFLSAPGQAYTDGMRFVQFYFGMPLALIVLQQAECVYCLSIFRTTVQCANAGFSLFPLFDVARIICRTYHLCSRHYSFHHIGLEYFSY